MEPPNQPHPPQTLALITSYAPSLVNFRAALIRALCARGVHVLALAPDFNTKTRAKTVALGAIAVDFPMSRTGVNPVLDLFNMWHLARLLRQLKPDITLGYFIKPAIFGSMAAKLAGVPRRVAMIEGLGFVFTPGATGLSIQRRVLKKLVLWLYKLGLWCAHRVVFLNPDDLAELVEAGALPQNKSFLLGGIGVDLDAWPFTPPVLEPVSFLLVGRLLREKGITDYAKAARLVKKHYPQARFMLLGELDDNPGAITRAEVQNWVEAGILEWPGEDTVQPWMAQTSVYVLPSYREGVPVSTQEALAMGRAVITTDVPGCRETVMDGVNGFLVPVRNPQALAEKMIHFIRHPELITTMGRASRRLAEEKYDVRKVNAVLLQEMKL